jgi:hypothetical protein
MHRGGLPPVTTDYRQVFYPEQIVPMESLRKGGQGEPEYVLKSEEDFELYDVDYWIDLKVAGLSIWENVEYVEQEPE